MRAWAGSSVSGALSQSVVWGCVSSEGSAGEGSASEPTRVAVGGFQFLEGWRLEPALSSSPKWQLISSKYACPDVHRKKTVQGTPHLFCFVY